MLSNIQPVLKMARLAHTSFYNWILQIRNQTGCCNEMLNFHCLFSCKFQMRRLEMLQKTCFDRYQLGKLKRDVVIIIFQSSLQFSSRNATWPDTGT